MLNGEIMLPGRAGEQALSAITVQSLADLGYGVDITQADPYNTREPYNNLSGTTPRAKLVLVGSAVPDVDAEPMLTCGAGLMTEPIHVVDPQGRIIRTIDNR